MERWFLPGKHFVAYRTPDEAAALADFYLQNEPERLHIAHSGHLRVRELIETKEFWRSIDRALHESGQESLLTDA
jgi:spore maturation protein CgeB